MCCRCVEKLPTARDLVHWHYFTDNVRQAAGDLPVKPKGCTAEALPSAMLRNWWYCGWIQLRPVFLVALQQFTTSPRTKLKRINIVEALTAFHRLYLDYEERDVTQHHELKADLSSASSYHALWVDWLNHSSWTELHTTVWYHDCKANADQTRWCDDWLHWAMSLLHWWLMDLSMWRFLDCQITADGVRLTIVGIQWDGVYDTVILFDLMEYWYVDCYTEVSLKMSLWLDICTLHYVLHFIAWCWLQTGSACSLQVFFCPCMLCTEFGTDSLHMHWPSHHRALHW